MQFLIILIIWTTGTSIFLAYVNLYMGVSNVKEIGVGNLKSTACVYPPRVLVSFNVSFLYPH